MRSLEPENIEIESGKTSNQTRPARLPWSGFRRVRIDRNDSKFEIDPIDRYRISLSDSNSLLGILTTLLIETLDVFVFPIAFEVIESIEVLSRGVVVFVFSITFEAAETLEVLPEEIVVVSFIP